MELWNATSLLATASSGPTNLDGAIANFAPGAAGTYYAHIFGAVSDYSLVVTKNAAFDSENNGSILLAQAVDPISGVTLGSVGTGTTKDEDYFNGSVKAGSPITISTATPAGGSFEFVNTLDPAIDLYDPSGTLVASNDNGAADGRNALLNYVPLVTGTYTVHVKAASGSGEYILSISGLTAGNHAPGARQQRLTKFDDDHGRSHNQSGNADLRHVGHRRGRKSHQRPGRAGLAAALL